MDQRSDFSHTFEVQALVADDLAAFELDESIAYSVHIASVLRDLDVPPDVGDDGAAAEVAE